MKTRTFALATLAAAMISANAVPAMADAPKGSTSIAFGDLDLSTDAGRAELTRRYDQAAREKCGVPDGQAPKGNAKYCYKNTSKQFQMFAADLISKHDRKSGLALR